MHTQPLGVDGDKAPGLSSCMGLLCLAARVLVLTEQRLRARLREQGTALAGLNPASRSQTTTTPTTERVIAVFSNLTVTVVRGEGWEQRHVSSLNQPQQHVLALLGLPPDLYERLGKPPGYLALQMPES